MAEYKAVNNGDDSWTVNCGNLSQDEARNKFRDEHPDVALYTNTWDEHSRTWTMTVQPRNTSKWGTKGDGF